MATKKDSHGSRELFLYFPNLVRLDLVGINGSQHIVKLPAGRVPPSLKELTLELIDEGDLSVYLQNFEGLSALRRISLHRLGVLRPAMEFVIRQHFFILHLIVTAGCEWHMRSGNLLVTVTESFSSGSGRQQAFLSVSQSLRLVIMLELESEDSRVP